MCRIFEVKFIMRLYWKCAEKMRCFRKRSTIPLLAILAICLLFLNLFLEEDRYVMEEGRRLSREMTSHQLNSEKYVHTFKDLTNFSGAINVTYRYLAGFPIARKSEFVSNMHAVISLEAL